MIGTSDAVQAYGRDLLRGERVRLRAVEEADLPRYAAWNDDPARMPLQSAVVRPQPVAASDRRYRDWGANADPAAVGFAVVALEDDGLVGFVALRDVDPVARGATLAISTGAERTGRGYGTDAVRTIVRYGFLAMGLHRVQLEVFAYNLRAIRSYQRVGFRVEVVRREALFVNGGFADELVMGLLRSEWAA